MNGMSLSLGALPPQRVLLVASLALNLFFVGGALAVAMQQTQTAPPPPVTAQDRSPAARIDRLAATLPPADAKRIYAEFQATEPTIEAARLASRQAQEAVRRALKAQPFDPHAVEAGLNALRDARRSVWRTLHTAIVHAATDMSPEGRDRLADWVPQEDGKPAPQPQPR